MSGHTQFAIWGAGNLGGLIAKYLLKHGVTLIILSRPESVSKPGLQELASKGTEIRPFVVTSPEATSALKGIDVLISTQGMTSLDLQDHILRPAVDAGVKLFVPAEFGITTDGRPEPIFAHKVHLREEAARLGLPTTAIFTGFWTEFILNVITGDNPAVLTIKGEGDGVISTTSMDDVARFTAYVLTSLPRDKLENAKFTLETDTLNANQLVELAQKYAPRKLEVERIPRSVFEERVAKDPGDVRAVMALTFDTGRGKHPNPPSHDVYPNWQPKSVNDVLKPIIEERYR